MTLSVDSVLRDAVRILSTEKCAEPVFAAAVDEARAAVAELVETCQQIQAHGYDISDYQRLARALARCGGAA